MGGAQAGMPGMTPNQHSGRGGVSMRAPKRQRPHKKKKGFGDL